MLKAQSLALVALVKALYVASALDPQERTSALATLQDIHDNVPDDATTDPVPPTPEANLGSDPASAIAEAAAALSAQTS